MSSTDYGSTVYDVIFVGGMVLSNSTLSDLQLCWLVELGQEELLLVLLQVVLQRLILPWKFWWGFKRKFNSLVFFFDSKSLQIIEAGPHTRDDPNHIQPGRYLSCLLRPTETFTFHVGKPSPAVCGRSLAVPTGRALGGGSSVNCMKAIFVINAQNWSYGSDLKFLLTQGRQLRITTIGKTYMGIKDGVPSIWYPFSKKLELYVLPTYLGSNYGVFFNRQKHFKRFQRIRRMATQDPSKCRLHKTPRRTSAEVSFLLLRNLIRNVVR
jgi:hypothetical protein